MSGERAGTTKGGEADGVATGAGGGGAGCATCKGITIYGAEGSNNG